MDPGTVRLQNAERHLQQTAAKRRTAKKTKKMAQQSTSAQPAAAAAEPPAVPATPDKVAPVTCASKTKKEYQQLISERKRKRQEIEEIDAAIRDHPENTRAWIRHASHTFFLPLKADKVTMSVICKFMDKNETAVKLYYDTDITLKEDTDPDEIIRRKLIVSLLVVLPDICIVWTTAVDSSSESAEISIERFDVISRKNYDTVVSLLTVDENQPREFEAKLKKLGVDETTCGGDLLHYVAMLMCLTHPDPSFYRGASMLSLQKDRANECIIRGALPTDK